ncbi:MAG: DUF58 domain-containing protein [Planctomycetes bacterium]|nr:DUF58 domain-containing protein [Planctomycetota bacterium]
MRVTRPVELPSPAVRFRPDYFARLGALVARLAAARERRDGAGRARLFGVGPEFVGFRPYRSGEDLRALDWNLFARLGRPYVRVSAREASEEWSVRLDASASMGVGRPGKLQFAAELAGAFVALGVARGARVELVASNGARCTAQKRADFVAVFRTLESLRAEGEAGLASLTRAARPARCGRLFLIGDLLDCAPRELLARTRPGCELVLAQVLAREELVPSVRAAVRWIDAESGQALVLAIDADTAAAYERRLERELEGWRRAAARHGALYGCWTSSTPFETAVRALGAREA